MAIRENFSQDDLMASINITPLTDVLLVLLMIFMITTALLQKERIQIPWSHNREQAVETDLVISIGENGQIFAGSLEVALPQLKSYLEEMRKTLLANSGTAHRVIVKADRKTPYRLVAHVMDTANSAGFHELSLATKPLEEEIK